MSILEKIVDAQFVEPAEQPTPEQIIGSLAALSKLEYETQRNEQAKALNIRASVLDDLVKDKRAGNGGDQKKMPFKEVEAHDEAIDPDLLLTEIADTIKRYIVLDSDQANAAALWVALTWFIDVVEVAPLAIINAPEKACAKTLLLSLMGFMSYRSLYAANASSSAIFRSVELWKPTILIDEADTFFKDNFELHGLVNAGYLKDGIVLRSEVSGDTFEPKMFSVYSAKALAGISLEKHLPDATMSRGIIFNLRRKLPHENVRRLRHAERGIFGAIAAKLARFSLDYSHRVRLSRPALPEELSDRDQDNWEGLLAIASCAGEQWLAKATRAALNLSGSNKAVSVGNELLADIQDVFESKKLTRISTADLIAALCADDELSWNTYNRGKQLSPRQLASRLKDYDITSKQMRLTKYENPQRGFEVEQFSDAFARYLAPTPNLPLQRYSDLNASNGEGYSVTEAKFPKTSESDDVTSEAAQFVGCNAVTAKTAISGGRAGTVCLDDGEDF